MKRPGPLAQMTMALVGLCGTLLLLADLFFGVLPDRSAQAMQLRRGVSEALAVQVATLLQNDDRASLQRTLDGVAARTEGVASLAVRRADGEIVMQAGDHRRHWHAAVGTELSAPEQVTVPLNAGGARWGSFEVAFRPEQGSAVMRFLRQPLVVTLLFFSVVGTFAFGLYMRRALQHLDPASVIPERVQGAFDAMAEGVVVLDTRSRVLLANKAFQALSGTAHTVRVGKALAALPWLGAALPDDAQAHPWARSMGERAASAGHTLVIGQGAAAPRHLVVNCAPINDAGGHVRGCMVTFSDVSELHQANQALRDAMGALEASRDEVQRQNAELERLATRDPLTGCLNRRSFHQAFDAALEAARRKREPLACVMVDIDHFKAVNDTHGHAIGDRVIQEVAKKLIESARSTDLVCRYGGEEFCVVLPGLDQAEAMAFAERVRERVQQEAGLGVRELTGLRVTASLGVDNLSAGIKNGAMLIDRADQALYRAKRGGRNQVQAFVAPHPGAARELDAASGCALPSAFQKDFAALVAATEPRDTPLAALKIAVDAYPAFLVRDGQAAADAALREVATLLHTCARPGDLLVRLDAEHLGIVMPGVSIGEAMLWAEQLRARVAAGTGALSVSIGVDALPAQAPGAPTLMDRADNALTRAKRGGRNRIGRFGAESAPAVVGEAKGRSPLLGTPAGVES